MSSALIDEVAEPGHHARRGVMRLVLLATVRAFAASVVSSRPAYADSLTFHVTNYDNDGTSGVYLRNSADINDVNRDSAHYVTYSTPVELLCGNFGSAVGPKANTAWDYVRVLGGSNSGRTGFLSEHWLNTPVGANQHVGGESACGSSTPAPPAPTTSAAQKLPRRPSTGR